VRHPLCSTWLARQWPRCHLSLPLQKIVFERRKKPYLAMEVVAIALQAEEPAINETASSHLPRVQSASAPPTMIRRRRWQKSRYRGEEKSVQDANRWGQRQFEGEANAACVQRSHGVVATTVSIEVQRLDTVANCRWRTIRSFSPT
jgi:hypothetical protein